MSQRHCAGVTPKLEGTNRRGGERRRLTRPPPFCDDAQSGADSQEPDVSMGSFPLMQLVVNEGMGRRRRLNGDFKRKGGGSDAERAGSSKFNA
jgi:hypothetical protein